MGSEVTVSRTASTFSTAPIVQDEERPLLRSPDLCASYQWPCHLRIHPDRWEYVGGSWRLEIERVQLRPGCAGVGGNERDLKSIRDTRLIAAWAAEGDRKWVILPNGDKRLTPIYEDGLFLDTMTVSVVENGRLREGSIQLLRWENVDMEGNIVADPVELARVSRALARAIWNMDGPSPSAMAKVIKGFKRLHDQLEETSARRPNGGSPGLRRRIERLRANLHAVTGDAQYAPAPAAPLPPIPTPAPAPMAIPNVEPAAIDPRAAAMSYLAGLTPEELHKMLTSTGAALVAAPASSFTDTPPASSMRMAAPVAPTPEPTPEVPSAPAPVQAAAVLPIMPTPPAAPAAPRPNRPSKAASALPPIPGMEAPHG